MTGVGDDSRGRLTGRPFLVVGFILAIGATLALVLSNDLRYLRLAIVAALWAALIGAFLAVKYRKQATQSEDAVAEAQAVYELELEREIAARREYELEMEAESRSASDAFPSDCQQLPRFIWIWAPRAPSPAVVADACAASKSASASSKRPLQ